MAETIKLSERDRKILRVSQLRAAAPIGTIRRLSGHREHSIRYALKKYSELGLIQRRCFVDLCRLGYTHYEVFFTVSAEQENLRARLLRRLITTPQVSWIGELGGEYHWALNFCARDVADLNQFFEALSTDFGQIFLEKAIVVRLSLRYFGNRHLSPGAGSESLSYAATSERFETDQLDRKILYAVANTTWRNRSDIARALQIPASSLEFRLQRLQKARVICGYYYALDANALGLQSFLLLISLKGIDATINERFEKFCRKEPNIVVLIRTLGTWDVELAVETESMRDIVQLKSRLYQEFGQNLQTMKLIPSFGYLKISEYPLDASAPNTRTTEPSKPGLRISNS